MTSGIGGAPEVQARQPPTNPNATGFPREVAPLDGAGTSPAMTGDASPSLTPESTLPVREAGSSLTPAPKHHSLVQPQQGNPQAAKPPPLTPVSGAPPPPEAEAGVEATSEPPPPAPQLSAVSEDAIMQKLGSILTNANVHSTKAAPGNQAEIGRLGAEARFEISKSIQELHESVAENLTSLEQVNSNADKILGYLSAISKFALALSPSDANSSTMFSTMLRALKRTVFRLCTMPVGQKGESIPELVNQLELDSPLALKCIEIAQEIESALCALDAKINGGCVEEASFKAKGQCNSSYETTMPNGETRILKPNDKFAMGAAGACSFTNVQISYLGTVIGNHARNLATHAVQELMEARGAPHVGVNISSAVNISSDVDQRGRTYISMEVAEKKFDRKDILNNTTKVGPEPAPGVEDARPTVASNFIESETWLQLEDILTGQIDRHGNNLHISATGHVKGFDHDSSFPTLQRNTNTGEKCGKWICEENVATRIPKVLAAADENGNFFRGHFRGTYSVDGGSVRNFCMPPVIDTKMYGAIMNLDLNLLELRYRDSGLTRPEIDAAMARASLLKEEVKRMVLEDKVIKPDQWGNSALLRDKGCNSANFYAFYHSAGN